MFINTKKIGEGVLLLLVLGMVLVSTLFLADYVSSSPAALAFISQFGYLGAVLLSAILGLNVILPLPAASFVPLFTEAGLWLPGIILALTTGTLIADYLGFAFGKWSRVTVAKKYPKPMKRFEDLYNKHHARVPYVTFLYAAFMPLPNEAIILPLAVLGAPFRLLIIPLILGNLVSQTIFSYGIQNVFLWLF